MKQILMTIASVLLITAVVGVAYAQEADDNEAPIVTHPGGAGYVPSEPAVPSNPAPAAAAQPTIKFEISDMPASSSFDLSRFNGKEFQFHELSPEAQQLFLKGLPDSEKAYFQHQNNSDDQQFVYHADGSKFKDTKPWDGLVDRWKNNPSQFSISRERLDKGNLVPTPRGANVPKAYMVRWKLKF